MYPNQLYIIGTPDLLHSSGITCGNYLGLQFLQAVAIIHKLMVKQKELTGRWSSSLGFTCLKQGWKLIGSSLYLLLNLLLTALWLNPLDLPPFEMIYGSTPASPVDYLPGLSKAPAAQEFISDASHSLALAKSNCQGPGVAETFL